MEAMPLNKLHGCHLQENNGRRTRGPTTKYQYSRTWPYFIVVQYSTTNGDLRSNNRFRFNGNISI
jgi:hypothetical protein